MRWSAGYPLPSRRSSVPPDQSSDQTQATSQEQTSYPSAALSQNQEQPQDFPDSPSLSQEPSDELEQ